MPGLFVGSLLNGRPARRQRLRFTMHTTSRGWWIRWSGGIKRVVVSAAAMISVSAMAGPTVVLDVWPGGAPEAIADPGYEEGISYWGNDHNWPLLERISRAQLEVYLPDPEKASGVAMVIIPGGGYYSLNIAKEGRDVAEWLAARGVAGVVLKYRLPSEKIMKDRAIGPLQDVQEAMRLVRRHAVAWKIRPDRIGVMGFSAGGHLAALVSTEYRENTYKAADGTSARPDFTVLVYALVSLQPGPANPGVTKNLVGEKPTPEQIKAFSAELHVDAQTPPALIVQAADDQAVSPENSLRYFQALRAHGVPAELHLYERGNHGFGLGTSPDGPKAWTEELVSWLRLRGLGS